MGYRNARAWVAGTALGLSLAALTAGAAQAEDAEVSTVVVTAPRLEDTLPADLARYGSDLETISSDTVRDNVYLDLSQALQMQVPGLYIAPQSGPFSYVDLSLQGSRTGDVLWLVDGVRINNRLYTSTSPADTLPASMIERVEVLKGGQALFYGTQAAAGVINVVTRGYSQDLSGELTVGGDTNQGVHVDGYIRDTIGRHKFVLWASKDEAEGFTAYDVFQPSATARKRAYDVTSVGGKYGLDLTDDLALNLYYQHTEAHLDYPGARLTNKSYNDRNEEIASASLDYKPSDRAEFSLKGYYHDWDTLYTTINNVPGQPGVTTVESDDTYWGYEDYGVSALAKLRLHKGFEYQIGYDFQNFSGVDEELLIAKQTEKVHAVVGQVRTTEELFDNAHLAAGVRYNKTGESEATVWNVSGHWGMAPSFYVEGNVGTAFVLPSAEQLFGIDPCCAVGNPNLEPEESLNLNVTLGGTLGERLTWQATGFARKIDNLIADNYDLPDFPEGIYLNSDGKVKVRGWEWKASMRLTEDLTGQASFTYTRSRAAGSTLQLDRIPARAAKISLNYEPADRPFGASVNALWNGDIYRTASGFGRVNYGNYAVFDVAAHVYLDGQDRHHKVTARLENAFNQDYSSNINSGPVDLSDTQRFLFGYRGTPRTLHVTYAYSF